MFSWAATRPPAQATNIDENIMRARKRQGRYCRLRLDTRKTDPLV